MKIYYYNVVLKIMLLLILSMAGVLASAQTNIFRAGNVTITTSEKPLFGSVNLNNGDINDHSYFLSASGTLEVLITCVKPEKVVDYVVELSEFYNPKSLTLHGSQNSTDWILLDTKSPSGSTAVGTVANAQTYKYYKFVFNVLPGDYLAISEISGYSDDPVAPVLTATPGLSGDKANVSWNKTILNQGKYELQRSLNGTDFALIYTSNSASEVSYEDTALKAETSYWYRVRGINSKGPSDYSQAVKITTVDDIIKGTPVLSAMAGNVGNEVSFSWTGVTIHTDGQYLLEKSTDGINFTVLDSIDKSLNTYTYSTATASTNYWFRVKGKNYKSSTPFSEIAKVTTVDDIIKGTPVLSAMAGNVGNEVSFSWTGVTIHTDGQYLLEKSNDGINFTLLKTIDKSLTKYTDTTATRNTNYWYRIKGKNYKSSTPYSNIVFLTTVNDVLAEAPNLEVIQGITGQQGILSWSGLDIYTRGQFQLEKSSNGVDFTLFATVDKSINTYIDSTLTHSTDYWYRIRGINTVAPSPYSTIVKITTKSDFLTGIPTLTAVTNTGTNVNLSWNLSFPTKGGFELEKSVNGTDFTVMGKLDKSITAYTEESLSINTSYWYRVRAFNYAGYSPYSTTVKVTTNGIKALLSDITDDGGILTVSADNEKGADAAEGSSKFIDNNVATKWLTFNAQTGQSLSAVYQPTSSYIVSGYSLTTGNDAPGRDPKNWKFEGSDDKTTWTTLDTRTNQLGATERGVTYNYILNNTGTKAYKYYRIAFSANNNSSDAVRYQIAEWQIFGIDANSPDIPTDLAITSTTVNSISLSWAQNTTIPVERFILQRSRDGMNYLPIDTLAGTDRSYTDLNLYDGTSYYYRLKATGKNIIATSGWSNVATSKTLITDGIPLTPSDLRLISIDKTIVNLQWNDRSTNETGFALERSRDNVLFEEIKTLPAGTSIFSDATVWAGTAFYYRIKAIKDKTNSAYSNVLSVLTNGENNAPSAIATILPLEVCTGTSTFNLAFNGIISGPGSEGVQKLRVTAAKAGDERSKKFFSAYSFNPAVSDETTFNKLKTKGSIINFTVTTTGVAVPGDSAMVMVTVKDDGGIIRAGSDSTEFMLKVYFRELTVKITSDRKADTVPRYTLVKLTAVSNFPANTTIEWGNADGIESGRNGVILRVRPKRTTTYTLKATTPTGCITTASITLSPKDSLVVANVLTPNHDGKNDTWMVWGLENIKDNEVKVFDRQGRIVFTRKNYNNDWDGTYNGAALPQGGYYYVIETNKNEKPQTGVLMIIK